MKSYLRFIFCSAIMLCTLLVSGQVEESISVRMDNSIDVFNPKTYDVEGFMIKSESLPFYVFSNDANHFFFINIKELKESESFNLFMDFASRNEIFVIHDHGLPYGAAWLSISSDSSPDRILQMVNQFLNDLNSAK